MKKISDGYIYDVFDLENGRVFKRKRSFFSTAKNFKSWLHTYKHIRKCGYITNEIKSKLPYLPTEIFGNPIFINKWNFTQDKVTLLMDYFNSHNLEENKVVVDKYIELIIKLLRYGIHDGVYKFKNSYGINEKEEIVFIDFNESILNKSDVLNLIKRKHWKNEAQFRKFPEGDLKIYIEKKFEKSLTPEIIENNWNKLNN